MARTVQQLISDVLREVRGQATALEAQQALRDALDVIDSKANWEFLITKTLLNIEATYSTGTVAASTTTLTGAATTWVPAWKYKTIKMASRRMPYEVASFAGVTSGTLSTTLSSGTAVTADAYTIYQMRYALPTDCEPGRDLKIKGPTGTGSDGNGEIGKIPNLTFERRRQELGVSSLGPWWYTDGPYDETNRVATILLWPYPTTATELRLTYYRKLTIPTTTSSNIIIPQAFERLPILLAASQIMQTKNQSGWLEKKTMADRMMTDLYARHSVSPAYETELEPEDGGSFESMFASDSQMFTRDF